MKVQFLTESQRIRPVSYDDISSKRGEKTLFSDREIGVVTTHFSKIDPLNYVHADVQFSLVGMQTRELPVIQVVKGSSLAGGMYDWKVSIFPPRSTSEIIPIRGRYVSNLDEESAIELFDKAAAYILKNLDTTNYDSFWGSLIESMQSAIKKFGFR